MNNRIEKNDWILIPGFTSHYANADGKIASKKKNDYKCLTIVAKDKQTIRLSCEAKTTTFDVHYLIALTFIPNPNNYSFVKHKNGDSWDNHSDNLEWVESEPNYSSIRYSNQKMKESVDNFSEWKTLEDYPHYYFHSNGVVMSASLRVTIMKPILKPKPSLILINKNGEKGMIQIAFLIASAFIPNELGYTEIEYIDNDEMNTAASNLRWDVNSPTTLRDLKSETQDTDIWKTIGPYPGYLVSRKGEVVSTRLKHYVLMKPIEGQMQTSYRIRDETGVNQFTIPIQKLLGLAFIPNPCNYEFVAPYNGDMLDYDLDNLYWHSNPNGCTEEGWVEVLGYPNYEVSGFGIRNKDTKIMLNPMYKKGNDYPCVSLKDTESKYHTLYIHLVIARNKIPNPEQYPVVNHIDGNHSNYNVTNLEWCSYSQNLQHAHDTGLRNGSTSVTMTPTGKEIWKTIEIAPNYQISNTGIVKRNDGKIMKLTNHLGYHNATITVQRCLKKHPLVHRLVAFAFLDNDHLGQPLDPDIVYEVNHKNRIRSDNRIENLEIISVKHHREKDQGKAVIAVEPTTCDVKEFNTMTSAGEKMGCPLKTISRAIRDQEPRDGWYYFLRDDPELDEKVESICP